MSRDWADAEALQKASKDALKVGPAERVVYQYQFMDRCELADRGAKPCLAHGHTVDSDDRVRLPLGTM